jgi:hypothetical protein
MRHLCVTITGYEDSDMRQDCEKFVKTGNFLALLAGKRGRGRKGKI